MASMEYKEVMKKIGTREESMRGRVAAILFDNMNIVVMPQAIAEIISITPILGARGGERAEERHVLKAVEYLKARFDEYNTRYKITITPNNGLKLTKYI
jgi:hypothetical protein